MRGLMTAPRGRLAAKTMPFDRTPLRCRSDSRTFDKSGITGADRQRVVFDNAARLVRIG